MANVPARLVTPNGTWCLMPVPEGRLHVDISQTLEMAQIRNQITAPHESFSVRYITFVFRNETDEYGCHIFRSDEDFKKRPVGWNPKWPPP